MPHLNIEIKARCYEPERVRETLGILGARYRGLDHQTDTYFNSFRGRLKLRKGNIENVLIFYTRADKAGPKDSDVHLVRGSLEGILDILSGALGVKVVVDKKRHIYFIDNVKFHVDDVKDLGSFVEIEAIDFNGNYEREKLLEQCIYYKNILKIRDEDLIEKSYSDLLLEKELNK